jgi:hypothetical protein
MIRAAMPPVDGAETHDGALSLASSLQSLRKDRTGVVLGEDARTTTPAPPGTASESNAACGPWLPHGVLVSDESGSDTSTLGLAAPTVSWLSQRPAAGGWVHAPSRHSWPTSHAVQALPPTPQADAVAPSRHRLDREQQPWHVAGLQSASLTGTAKHAVMMRAPVISAARTATA